MRATCASTAYCTLSINQIDSANQQSSLEPSSEQLIRRKREVILNPHLDDEVLIDDDFSDMNSLNTAWDKIKNVEVVDEIKDNTLSRMSRIKRQANDTETTSTAPTTNSRYM